MKAASLRRFLVPAAVVLVAVVAFLLRGRIHFDGRAFLSELRLASPWPILTGTVLIVLTYWLRAVRWRIFLPVSHRVRAGALVGPQFVGFTATVFFGRLADLTRPYLVSRRVGLPVATQIAVYTIERMFDLGAAAVLFSAALAVTPRETPHHLLFVRAGMLSLAGTAFLAAFAVLVRSRGEWMAGAALRVLTPVSARGARAFARRLLAFREGLQTLSTGRDLGWAAAISMVLWTMVAWSYVETLHAFVRTPELAGQPFSRVMLLMAASMGGSLLQLPVVGWFTQIAVTGSAMHLLYGAPMEAATACGAVLLFVTTLSVVPFGLIWGRMEGTGVRAAARESSSGRAARVEGPAGAVPE